MYTMKYSPQVVAFFHSLCQDDQDEIKLLLETIRILPGHGKSVRSVPGLVYQKSYSLDKSRWPTGIRVTYHIFEKEVIIAIVDAGDHTTSASKQGASIYVDERRNVAA